MKVTKRELRRIISEERDRLLSEQNDTLLEGFKEEEMELIEDLVDMLIQRGAINDPARSMSGAAESTDHYQEALDYITQAVVPTLQDLAASMEEEKGYRR